jgi:hypothetical protein
MSKQDLKALRRPRMRSQDRYDARRSGPIFGGLNIGHRAGVSALGHATFQELSLHRGDGRNRDYVRGLIWRERRSPP